MNSSKGQTPKYVFLVVCDSFRGMNSIENPTITPTIEKLGQHGIKFNRAISPGGWTYTSFASILTGKYPSEHGIIKKSDINKIERHETLPERLSQNNITSASFTDSHGLSTLFDYAGINRAWKPTHTFFDNGLSTHNDLSFEGADGIHKYLSAIKAALTADHPIRSLGNLVHLKMRPGIKKLNRVAGRSPPTKDGIEVREIKRYLSEIDSSNANQFLLVHLSGAHFPWKYKREMVEDITGPISDEKHDKLQVISKYAINNLKEHQYGADLSETEIQSLTTLYKSYVHGVDSHIETLVDVLESMGVYDQSIIIITSDHGKVIGKNNYFGHRIVDDDVTHVPLIIGGPSVPTKEINRPVSVRQLYNFVPSIYNQNQDSIEDDLINTILSEEVVMTESYGDHVTQRGSHSKGANIPGYRLVGYSEKARGEIRFDDNKRIGDNSILEQLQDYIDSSEIITHK